MSDPSEAHVLNIILNVGISILCFALLWANWPKAGRR